MLASFSFVGYMIMDHRSLDLNRRDSWKRVINGRMSSQVWLGQVDDDDTTSASRCSEQKDSDGEEDDDDDDSDSDSSDGEDSANEASSKVVIKKYLDTTEFLYAIVIRFFTAILLRSALRRHRYLWW